MANPKDLVKKARSFAWDKQSETFRDTYEPLYRDGVELGGGAVTDDFDVDDPATSAYLDDYIGARIVQLQETSKQLVIDKIRSVLESDDGAKSPFELGSKILDALEEQGEGFERYRADRIARTETGFAYNGGTVLGTAQEGFDAVDVTDGDSDEECTAANGSVWGLDYAMANLLEHPNCERAFGPHVGEVTEEELDEA